MSFYNNNDIITDYNLPQPGQFWQINNGGLIYKIYKIGTGGPHRDMNTVVLYKKLQRNGYGNVENTTLGNLMANFIRVKIDGHNDSLPFGLAIGEFWTRVGNNESPRPILYKIDSYDDQTVTIKRQHYNIEETETYGHVFFIQYHTYVPRPSPNEEWVSYTNDVMRVRITRIDDRDVHYVITNEQNPEESFWPLSWFMYRFKLYISNEVLTPDTIYQTRPSIQPIDCCIEYYSSCYKSTRYMQISNICWNK